MESEIKTLIPFLMQEEHNLETPKMQIQKGLNYLQKSYEAIADTAKARIESNSYEDDKEMIAEYGIYYNAIAGLLRSGVLCSRITGDDGFPEIQIILGSKTYQCREDVLRMILKDEADYIISPYEDTFESYLDAAYTPKVITNESTETEPENTEENKNVNLKKIQKKHKKEIDQLKAEYEKKIKELEENAAHASETQVIATTMPEEVIKTIQVPDEAALQELQEKIEILQREKAALTKENKRLTNEAGEHEGTISKIKAQLKAKSDALDEAQKYEYDPNYDHYYSDVLPKLVDSLEFTHRDLVYKFLAMGLCVGGLIISALFIL